MPQRGTTLMKLRSMVLVNGIFIIGNSGYVLDNDLDNMLTWS